MMIAVNSAFITAK